MAAFTFAQLNWSNATESSRSGAGRVGQLLAARRRTGARPGVHARGRREADAGRRCQPRLLGAQPGSDPAIVGKTLTLNRTPFTVVGVGRRGFTGTLLAVVRRCGCRCPYTTSCSRINCMSSGAGSSCSRSVAGAERLDRSGVGQPEDGFAQLEQAFPNDNKRPQRRSGIAAPGAAESSRHRR